MFLPRLAGGSVQLESGLGVALEDRADLSAQRTSARGESIASGPPRFAEFVSGLQVIAKLLEPRERPVDNAAVEADRTEDDSAPRASIDPDAFRFSVKLGAAITLGLLIGLTTQRADLQTILWSIAVAGQPNQ